MIQLSKTSRQSRLVRVCLPVLALTSCGIQADEWELSLATFSFGTTDVVSIKSSGSFTHIDQGHEESLVCRGGLSGRALSAIAYWVDVLRGEEHPVRLGEIDEASCATTDVPQYSLSISYTEGQESIGYGLYMLPKMCVVQNFPSSIEKVTEAILDARREDIRRQCFKDRLTRPARPPRPIDN
jgi:hypothetical protein